MRRVTRRGAALVLLAVVALLGTTAVALAASQQFGYHKVRKGLPNGLSRMTVTSTDLKAGKPIPPQFWGCTNAGVSPELSWQGVPAGTQSFVVTMFDSDAPTGSGFWHWVAWDIPVGTTSLPTGAILPPGSVSGQNDGGTLGYSGPCPPAGDRTHHYHITVVAVNAPTLGVGATTHAAVVGFLAGQQAVASGELVATAQQ